MSNFAVSIPSYLHVSHGDEDTIKDCLIGGKIIEFDGSMFDLTQKVKNMLLIKNIETVVFNDELHIIWEEDNNGIEYDIELSKGEPFIITLILSNFYKEASINDINIEFRPCNYRIKVIPQAGNKFEYITKTDISPEPINLFTTNPLRIAKRLKGSNDDYEWKHIVFGPNDLIENGIDRLVYKVEKENILLECVQATSVDNNIADIFNMNNNYRNAF
jgi:hypothetical protein